MKRRDFLLAASGVAGGTAATASAAAQETTTSGGGNQSGGNGTTGGNQTGGNGTSGNNSSGNQSEGGGGGGGGPTKTVKVVDNAFEPQEISVTPGTTVKWVWEGNGHNIVVQNQPSGSNWQGTEGGESKLYDSGHTHEHTFEATGSYEYYCAPHKALGMTGTISVGSGGGGGGGGGEEEADPEEMGVAFQAHYVGIATILMMIVSLIYTFFFLKYGESAHTSGGGQ
ncbi:plastocyanin/azurin family copper-binding protein [Halomicrococcus sp. NG-SE-24]|uniref:plastocyanin/azurin family copper-binding protein n=1 Tax=Halomicrococcus sp. NG-SE-24 TaxID=3436928 RepID=UPI003D98C649